MAIKNIIFDFGDVIIDIDHQRVKDEFVRLGGKFPEGRMWPDVFYLYEQGLVSTSEFLSQMQSCFDDHVAEEVLINTWNSLLADMPQKRLDFIAELRNDYKVFLLSNTNEMHIDDVDKNFFSNSDKKFRDLFDKAYLSFELQLVKPSQNIFEYVLNNAKLVAEETVFIDDTLIHVNAAKSVGMHAFQLDSPYNMITEMKSFLCA